MKKTNERNQEIIKGMLDVLSIYPPEDMNVTLLIQHIPVSRTTLYRMFASKEKILQFLDETILKEFIAIYNFAEKHLGHQYFTRNLCMHVLKYRNYYNWQLHNSKFIELLTLKLKEVLLKVYENHDYAIFASYGTIGYIVDWVRSGFIKSPLEAAEGLIMIGQHNWKKYHSQ